MGYTMNGDYQQLGASDSELTSLGNQALTILHTQLKSYGYTGTRDQMIQAMSVGSTGKYLASLVPITIEGFGLQMDTLGLSSSQVTTAFKKLASQSQGRVPTKTTAFNAMGNVAQNPSWISAVTYTATESVKDVVTGAQKIGDAVVTAGKVTTWLLPAIPIVILAGLFLRAKGGNVPKVSLASGAKGLARAAKRSFSSK